MLGDTNGYDVLIAMTVAIPSTLAAVFAWLTARRVRMPNGTRMGDAVAQTQASSADSAAILRKLDDDTPTDTPEG